MCLGRSQREVAPFPGVGVKAGAEVLVHVARQWLGRNKQDVTKVLAMLDLKNAFNSIDRSAIRLGIRGTYLDRFLLRRRVP